MKALSEHIKNIYLTFTHAIVRPEPRVRFLRSGDAFGFGARFNTCIYLSWSECHVLIDCGASSMIAIRDGGGRANPREQAGH